MDKIKKVTVSIPVYNVEDYIEQCLQSVVDQTYKDIEILVIDDCTKDWAGKIADEFARHDKRIRVIHKPKNEGLAAARETTISEMKGDAVYWLDSDDYLRHDAIANSVKIMNQTGADIVKTIFIEKEQRFACTYTQDEYMRILIPDIIKSNVTGCLIRKDVYNGIHHTVGLNFEDYDTFPKMMANVNKIVVENSRSYIYRVLRPESIMAAEQVAHKGYHTKALLMNRRFMTYKDKYPEQCNELLKQYVDNACMANLCSKEYDLLIS